MNPKMDPPCIKKCKGAYGFHPGIVGARAKKRGLLLILHRPDKRIMQPSLIDNNDYEQALFHDSQTGRIITEMLAYLGLTLEDIYLTNLFKCCLQNHRFPTQKEYQECLSRLEKQIREIYPRKIIAFGKHVLKALFPEEGQEINGQELFYQGYPTFVTNHPSFIYRKNKSLRDHLYSEIECFLGKRTRRPKRILTSP